MTPAAELNAAELAGRSSADQAQFLVGLERSVRHWLGHWQQHADDAAALQAVSGHALRSLELCAQSAYALDLAIDLVHAMHEHMWFRESWRKWEAILRQLLLTANGNASSERLFDLRCALSAICFRQHLLEESIALAQENYRWARQMNDNQRRAGSAILLAEAFLNANAPEQALAFAEEAARFSGSWHAVDGLINSARALLAMDKLAEADERLQKAAALATAKDLPAYQAKAQLFLGHAAAQRNRWQDSLAHYQAALALVNSYGDQAGQATVQTHMGYALMALDQLDEAACLLQDALRTHRHLGNQPAEQIALQRLQETTVRRREIGDGRLSGNENVDKS